MRNAIIYLTHHSNEHDNIQLSHLTETYNCQRCENDIYVVLDITHGDSTAERPFHIETHSGKLINLKLIKLTETEVTDALRPLNYVFEYYETTSNPLFYGNCMLMIMHVWMNLLRHSDYDYVWVIEHDVYFKGDWSYLFDFFADKDDDFIPAQINPYSLEFWHAHQHNFKEDIPLSEFLVSFNPIMRLSRKALDTLDESYQKGSSGFYEIFPATLFNHLGMKQYDICSYGFADRQRFTYIKNRSLPAGLMTVDNYLYHPVKDAVSIHTYNCQ